MLAMTYSIVTYKKLTPDTHFINLFENALDGSIHSIFFFLQRMKLPDLICILRKQAISAVRNRVKTDIFFVLLLVLRLE